MEKSILVIEAGASKTDFFTNVAAWEFQTIESGYNALWGSIKNLETILDQLPSQFPTAFDTICYYGAGCINVSINEQVALALNRKFKNDLIEVKDDLSGAAIACFQDGSGIVSILGTGSISAKYNNGNITDKIQTLGFLAGDHGSGANLGRMIAQAWFYRELSSDIEKALLDFLESDQQGFKTELYKSKNPAAYIANLSKFAALNRTNEKIRELLINNYRMFIQRVLKKYDNWESETFSFSGGFVNAFTEELLEICAKENLTVGNIIEKPGHKLIDYHINKLYDKND
jgi:glucosamine kinase